MFLTANKIKDTWLSQKDITNISIYINIPFCLCQCRYCLYKGKVAPNSEREDFVTNYLVPLLEDFSQVFDRYEVDDIYFGGGTPNSVDLYHIAEIIRTLPWTKAKNKIFEINPAFTSEEYVRAIANMGFTTITFGAQSFDKPSLEFQRRPWIDHERIRKFSNAIHGVGAYSSLDIMCYLKTYTQEDIPILEQDLIKAAETGVDFITVYPELNLILHDKTSRDKFDEFMKNLILPRYYCNDPSYFDQTLNPRSIYRLVKKKHSYEDFQKKIYPYIGNDFAYASENILGFGDAGCDHEVFSYIPGKLFYVERNLGGQPFYQVKYSKGVFE